MQQGHTPVDEELTTADSSARYVSPAWREALEMWVDAKQSPARIGLAGQLDSWTSANLIPIVKEMLAAGIRDFELRTPSLNVPDAVGAAALDNFANSCLGKEAASSGTVRR